MLKNQFAFFLAQSVLAFTIFTTSSTAEAQLDQRTVRFVEDVLFEAEYDIRPQRFCKLWSSAPRLSTFGPDNQHPRVIKNVVKQLNECLPDKIEIEILSPGDESATLKIYFVPLDDFPQIAEANGFQAVENNWGFFYTSWNYQFEIEKAVVMIATDKLSGSRLHHFALEEITQSLGFVGDSKRFEKSVFFENADQRKYGSATNFSTLDKKLIRFHYKHNQPGDTPVEVGMRMAKHW